MLRRFWGFVTSSFCCHDCRRLRKELERTTHSYIASLKQVATTRQLYERDGDGIARRLNLVSAQVNEVIRLLTKSGKKKRRKA